MSLEESLNTPNYITNAFRVIEDEIEAVKTEYAQIKKEELERKRRQRGR